MTGQLHPSSHPDPDSLNAFLEGVLPEHERRECLAHFAECPVCREAVFLAQQPPPAVAEPSPIPVWRRWLAPIPVLSGALAACALAVVIFLYLFHGPEPPVRHVIARVNLPQQSPVAPLAATRAPVRTAQRGVKSHTTKSGLSEVTGLVTDPSGAVVPGANVALHQLAGNASGDARTDSDGHFTLAALPAGRYKLQIDAPGFQQASRQVELQAQGHAEIASVLQLGAATESVAVVAKNTGHLAVAGRDAAELIKIMPGMGSFSGTVVDSSSAVVPDAKVALKDEAGQTVREAVSDGGGNFKFDSVNPGSYTLTVSAAGFTRWEERGIPLTQEARLTIPNIVLQVGGTKSEVAVVGANDVVVPADTGQTSTTLNQQMISQISLAGRDAAELTKIMPGTGSFNGTVTDSFSAVVPGAKVVLKDEAGQTVREVVSDGRGHFKFDSVNPGSYALSVSAAGFTTWEKRGIQFNQGSRLTIPNIVLQVGGTKLEVAVVAANHANVPTYSGQASVQPSQTTSSYSTASDSAGMINIMPGGPLPPLPTVRIDTRVLTVNSAGGLLFSRNAGKSWKNVKPRWPGKVVSLGPSPAAGRPVFQLTTDSGSVWLSQDGTHWHPAPVQH